MIIVDANLLLYAYDGTAPQQKAAASWLEQTLASGESIALPWVTIWAFLRISTNPRIWRHPITVTDAFAVVGDLLAQPTVVRLDPGPRHWELLQQLVMKYNAGGPRLTDAALAALAIENGAVLASADRDFARFAGLHWVNPLDYGKP